MKKRIVSSIMCLAMLLSLLPGAAFAGDETTKTDPAVAVAAPLGVNSKLDNNRAKGYADTYDIGVTGTDPSYTVKFTATGLKSHKTSTEGGAKGYWVGVGIKVPEGATVKAGWGTYGAESNQGTLAPKPDGTVDGYSTYYFNVGNKDKTAGFIAVTPKAEGNTPNAEDGVDASATTTATTTVYNLDFTDVTLAEPSLELDFSSSGKAIDKNFFDRLAEIRPSSYQKPSDDWTEDGPNYDSEKDTISIIAPGLDMSKTYHIELKDDASPAKTYTVTGNDGLTPPNYDSAAYRATFTGIGATIPALAKPTDSKSVKYTVTLSEKSESGTGKALPLTQEIEIAQVTLDPNGGTFDLTSHKTAFADKNKDGVTNGATSNPTVWANIEDTTADKAVFFAKTNTKLSEQLTDNVIPVPTKEGAKFVGWKVTSIGGTAQTDAETVAADAVTISNSCTITAQWEGDSIVDAVLQKTVGNTTTDVATVKAEIGQPSADKKVVIKLSGTLDTLSGAYKLAYTLASEKTTEPVTVTFTEGEDGKTVGTISNLKVGDYTYTVDASDVIVVKVEMADPAVDTDAIKNISSISDADKAELTTAMTGKDAITVAAETKGALTGAAASVAADALEAAKGEMVNGTTYAVEISLAVVPTGYDSTKNTMTLEIKPVLTLVPLGEDGNKDEDGTVINSNVKPEVTEPVKISVKLPATLAKQQTLFVKHTKDNGKTYIYNGTVETDVLTFTNLHGFSTFEVTTNGPVAKIGDIGYATLKDALKAAGNNAVITLTEAAKDATADVTVDADKTVTLKTSVTGGVKVTINGTAYTVPAGNDGVKVELKKSTGGSSSNGGGGGGGGVSSNVTVNKATNGKVSVTPTAPSKGATVTINLTPDTGYVVGTVTVTDKDGKAVELTKVSDTKYTFTMPDGKVKVTATFTKADAPTDGFTDVPADAYYADAVKWAVEKGITNGLTATTFGPNNSCTRGQMVTFLWRAAGSPAATGTNSFSDVASGEYYYNAVLWAVEKGITNGTSATTFSPNATVNRGQTVTFLYRYAESPAATGTSSFTDVAADAFYADAVKWAVAEEITNGTSSTTFSPASNCTRGQIVTFMYRQMAE